MTQAEYQEATAKLWAEVSPDRALMVYGDMHHRFGVEVAEESVMWPHSHNLGGFGINGTMHGVLVLACETIAEIEARP